VKRRALLSTFAVTSASVGLAGCSSYLSGCRGVEFALSLSAIDEREALRSARHAVTGDLVSLVEEAAEGPVEGTDDLAERLRTRSLVFADGTYYRVEYDEGAANATYTAERLSGEATALAAGVADLESAAEAESARALVRRSTDEEVGWCTRDDGADAYDPVVDAIARQSGYGQQVYYLHGETVTAPARWDGRYYRADLWAETAE